MFTIRIKNVLGTKLELPCAARNLRHAVALARKCEVSCFTKRIEVLKDDSVAAMLSVQSGVIQ